MDKEKKKEPQLALAVQQIMVKKNYTLALAESCTGGFLSHLITKNPGSSQYFLGSLVVYSNELKKKLLGVPSSILQEKGAVCVLTVRYMLDGLLELTKSDFGIAVSGVAGPEGEAPIGTVWYGVGCIEKTEVGCMHFEGTRAEIIQQSAHAVLEILYNQLTQKYEKLC